MKAKTRLVIAGAAACSAPILMVPTSAQVSEVEPEQVNKHLDEPSKVEPSIAQFQSSPVSGATEILCRANNDCISTTFCCSSYSCVNPRTCLHGNKTELDVCDYNFECLSRCCVNGACNHILQCYAQCETNQDCFGKTI